MDCMRAFACIKSVCFLNHKNSNYCSKCSSAESLVVEQLQRYDVKWRREGGERWNERGLVGEREKTLWDDRKLSDCFPSVMPWLDTCVLVGAVRGWGKNAGINGSSVDCVAMPSATWAWIRRHLEFHNLVAALTWHHSWGIKKWKSLSPYFSSSSDPNFPGKIYSPLVICFSCSFQSLNSCNNKNVGKIKVILFTVLPADIFFPPDSLGAEL